MTTERASWRQRAGVDAEEVLGHRRAPLGQAGRGERRPAGLQGVVEHVAVGEVLDEEAVGIPPVVEDLAALDVAADAPGPEIAVLGEVFAACGERIEVAHLIGGMHVAVGRSQREREGVVVGRGRAAVAADEAHHRPTGALAGVEEEVADDHPEVVEVEVERLGVPGGLQHDVSEPLNAWPPPAAGVASRWCD